MTLLQPTNKILGYIQVNPKKNNLWAGANSTHFLWFLYKLLKRNIPFSYKVPNIYKPGVIFLQKQYLLNSFWIELNLHLLYQVELNAHYQLKSILGGELDIIINFSV